MSGVFRRLVINKQQTASSGSAGSERDRDNGHSTINMGKYKRLGQAIGDGLKRLLNASIFLALVIGCVRVPSVPETRTAPPRYPVVTVQAIIPSPTVTHTPAPTPSPIPTPVCTDEFGLVEDTTYPGFVLSEQIALRIYLPPCYDQGNEQYPVLYLLHGISFDESQWDELGVDELADDRIVSNAWPSFVVVMPYQPEPLFTRTDGGPGSYEAEIVEGLVPYIDRTYRTDPRPEARALGGISRGGVWALEVAFRHPDVFNAVAALSPALHMNYARPAYDPFNIIRKSGPLPRLIFLSAGDQEVGFRATVEKLSQALEEVGVIHTLIIGSGGHNAEAWMTVMVDMLESIIAGWPCDEMLDGIKDFQGDRFRVQ